MKIKILSVLIVLMLVLPAKAEPSQSDYRLDNEFFRRGLIDRGFDDWLKVYDEQHPAATDIDLLAEQIGRAWLNYRRETDPKKRTQKLDALLHLEQDRVESYSDHPLAANWRVRYAGDLLNEKIGPLAFVHLVHLSLPDNLRGGFQSHLDQIDTQLNLAKKFLQTHLAEFKKLNDDELAKVNRQGLPELYQSSLFQSDYLRAWSLYHRVWLMPETDPNRVKFLYQLSDLLQSMSREQSDSDSGSGLLLQAKVDRLLGKYSPAKASLDQSLRSLPGTYLLFAYIEQALLALAENQPPLALQSVEKARSLKLYQNDPARRDLADLSLLMLEGRAKLAALSSADRANTEKRNEIWFALTAALMAKPDLQPFVFPQVLKQSDNCSLQIMADLELFIHAEDALRRKNLLRAQDDLRELISRKSLLPAMKIAAAIKLAVTLEQQGQFAEAVKILSETKVDDSADILAETARLAWLAYQADHAEASRKIFIQAATHLLDRFPQSDSADQFKLLMADDFSQAGDFTQALQWVSQVPAGSPRYLQARTARILSLTRQYKAQAAGSPNQAGPAQRVLAGQIEKACDELFILASAKQKTPEKIESWTLTQDQVNLLSGAVLSAADVLSDPSLNRGDFARKMLDKYRPLLNRYQQTSKSALAVQITMLVQTASPAGRIEAVNLTLKMLDEKQLPVDQLAATTLFVLETIHQTILVHQADLSAKPDDLARANFNLARKSGELLLGEKSLTANLADRLRSLYIISAVDAGQMPRAKEALTSYKTAGKTESPDLTLARMKLNYAEKRYTDSASASMQLLQELTPADIRYWHTLIVNLRSHLALGSDHEQIAAAILARKQEYPELGSTATREELEKILKTVQ